ncbi:MAG: nicotinamide-nucleotide adenylyltransferase [Crenarchaeota archaeon]|nr:nicotinamide-nucleotide adenylyltransferase [Thermoproteota archaeon]
MLRVLFVGRFQPPHLGHIHVLSWCLGFADEVVVVIGSAQESYTLKNPFTVSERLEMLRCAVREAGLPLAAFRFVPLQDINMNPVWPRYLETMVPRFHLVVTGNRLVAELFRDYGYPVAEPPFYRREVCSGTRIRSLMVSGDESWRSLVPACVASYIDGIDGVGRLRRIYGCSGGGGTA